MVFTNNILTGRREPIGLGGLAAGFTLVEVLTALVIGSILLLGAVTIMVNSKDAYETQDDMARLQENARFAMNLLIKDIRMAGYFGCSADAGNIYDHIDDADAPGGLFNSGNGLEGMNNYLAGTSTWEPSAIGTPIDADVDGALGFFPGSDGITIRYLDPATAILIDEEMPQPSAELKVSSVGNLQDGQIVAITDCNSTDIFQLTSVQTGSLHLQHNAGGSIEPGNANPGNYTFSGCNPASCLSKSYGTDAKVMGMKAVRYYIADDDADGNPSLHRFISTPSGGGAVGSPQKLVDGIDSLQITYGEDTTGNGVADTYRDSDTVVNWANVSTVRIGMLLNTVDEYGQQINESAYTVNGENFAAANDRRRRRLFTTTVLLRNPQ
ncbi:MAG: PilW family protein [Immundisolibacteraceae bacterium]|nr:PilW family protein [Immundisolibacteraceae bacterium]